MNYRIAFCLPGREFSDKFLESWSNLIASLPPNWEWYQVIGYVPNVFYSRQKLLDRAKILDPTHYMWIDSDQVFKSEDFYSLISRDLDIISGVYYRSTGDFYNKPEKFACSMLDGPTLRMKDIVSKESPIEIHANGMGFMLVKSEVFRILNQPFMPENEKQWEGEDFTFQEKARKKGFKSYIDPKVIIGHEKKFIM
jgi:GT2 family glycosyltransferase